MVVQYLWGLIAGAEVLPVDDYNSHYHINKTKYGHKMESLISSERSEYKDESMMFYPQSFKPTVSYIPHPSYLNCYVLSVNIASKQPKEVVMKLDLFADNFGRVDRSSSLGFALYISQNNVTPFEHKNQIFLGQNIKIDVSLTYNQKLPAPYGVCLKSPKYDSIWTLHGEKLKYSIFGCHTAMLLDALLKRFGCDPFGLEVLGHKNIEPHVRSCWNETSFGFAEIAQTFESSLHLAHSTCLRLCEDVSYPQQITSFPWITVDEVPIFYEEHIKGKSYEDKFLNFTEVKKVNDMNSYQLEKLHELIKRNFAKVTIKLDLREIVVFKEIAQFSFTSFIGALGGILNLYSGISFLIVIELADFFINMCKRNCNDKIHAEVP